MACVRSPSSLAASCLRGLRVLIVEDCCAVAKALQSLLEEYGMVIAGPAASVADAERLFSEQTPQLAVVDVKLKGETAFGLINRLQDARVPVVVVSGSSAFSTQPARVATFLQKPFSGADLLEALHDVVTSTRVAGGSREIDQCKHAGHRLQDANDDPDGGREVE